jgi:hypothetical protein
MAKIILEDDNKKISEVPANVKRIGVFMGIIFSSIMFMGMLAISLLVTQGAIFAVNVNETSKVVIRNLLIVLWLFTIFFGIGSILSILLLIFKNWSDIIYIVFGSIILIPNLLGGIMIIVGAALVRKQKKVSQ